MSSLKALEITQVWEFHRMLLRIVQTAVLYLTGSSETLLQVLSSEMWSKSRDFVMYLEM